VKAYDRYFSRLHGPIGAGDRAAGNVVAISGEGADEALAGYIWYKKPRPSRIQEWLNRPLERLVRQLTLSALIGAAVLTAPNFELLAGFASNQQLSWEIMGHQVVSRSTPLICGTSWATGPLRRDHAPPRQAQTMASFNQSLYVGYKVHLAGLLLFRQRRPTLRAASTEGVIHFLMNRSLIFARNYRLNTKSEALTDKWFVTARGRQSCS